MTIYFLVTPKSVPLPQMQADAGKSHRPLNFNISKLNLSPPPTPSHILDNPSHETQLSLLLLKLLVPMLELFFWIIVALDHCTLQWAP